MYSGCGISKRNRRKKQTHPNNPTHKLIFSFKNSVLIYSIAHSLSTLIQENTAQRSHTQEHPRQFSGFGLFLL